MKNLIVISLGVFVLFGMLHLTDGEDNVDSERRRIPPIAESTRARAGDGCGGCGSSKVSSERACFGEITEMVRESFRQSYSCGGWWRRQRCYRTAYRFGTRNVPGYSCCQGYELIGQTCRRTGCGISGYSDAGKRPTPGVDGVEVRRNELPWQVRLSSGTLFKKSSCGGTILSDEYILTAARCVDGVSPANIKVIVGDQHRAVHADRLVSRVYTHTTKNIAILRLRQTLNLNQAAVPACLPLPDRNFNNRGVVISGWFKTKDLLNPYDLRYKRVNVTAQSICRDRYGRSIGTNEMCTTDGRGNPARSACFGDFGSPMVLEEDGRFIVIGVASFESSSECAADPSGYVEVSHYIDWIKRIARL